MKDGIIHHSVCNELFNMKTYSNKERKRGRMDDDQERKGKRGRDRKRQRQAKGIDRIGRQTAN